MREAGDGAVGAVRPQDFGLADGPGADGSGRVRSPVSGNGWGALRSLLARMGFVLPAPGRTDADQGTLPRGWGHPSRPGHPDGGAVRPPRGRSGAGGLDFGQRVEPGGYAWWYLDAISDDGRNALTVIVFVGSVFSPYYAAARRRGGADPEHHVGINAILYTPQGKYWAMTERGRGALDRGPGHIAVGPSAWSLAGDRLTIDIDEWTVPIPKRLRGQISVDLGPIFDERYALDQDARHTWRPIAPCARVDVAFGRPGLGWQGRAYLDMNTGSEPIETEFTQWNWSREDSGNATRIHYDVTSRSGRRHGLALEYRCDGSWAPFAPSPLNPLPKTGWRVARAARAALGQRPEIEQTLEDTPFYSRSMLAYRHAAGVTRAIHESVDLDRFRSPWVQILLPFKMPRRSG